MGKRKHRRSKSSPGVVHGRRGNSFDSSIDGSPKKREEDEELKLDPRIIAEPSQLGFHSVNFGDDYPIFNPSMPMPLPSSHSHSCSSCNSSISLRLPSSNVSSASHSSRKQISHSFDGANNRKIGSRSDFEEQLTFPVSDMGSLVQAPPPVQEMNRSEEAYDPNRIPASIFETDRTVEWSAASNESLFSLNLGRTNNLSPEQFFPSGGDMIKSGELDPIVAHRLSATRSSVSDSSQWLQISDVEINHVLKKIEENGLADSDQESSSDEEENAYPEKVTKARDDNKNKVQSNQTENDLKHATSLEASLRHGEIKGSPVVKGSKNSEESIKSTDSFAFNRVLSDQANPKHVSSIPGQQHKPEPKPEVEKAKKRWFKCWDFSPCCSGSCSPCFLGSCACSFCSCSSVFLQCKCCWCSNFSCFSKCCSCSHFRCFGKCCSCSPFRCFGKCCSCSHLCCFRKPRLGGYCFFCC